MRPEAIRTGAYLTGYCTVQGSLENLILASLSLKPANVIFPKIIQNAQRGVFALDDYDLLAGHLTFDRPVRDTPPGERFLIKWNAGGLLREVR